MNISLVIIVEYGSVHSNESRRGSARARGRGGGGGGARTNNDERQCMHGNVSVRAAIIVGHSASHQREIRDFGPKEIGWQAKRREINIENVMVTIEVQWKRTVLFNDAFTPIYTNN